VTITRIAEGVKLDNLRHVGHNGGGGAHTVNCGARRGFRVTQAGNHVGWGARGGGARGPLHVADGSIASGAQAGIPDG